MAKRGPKRKFNYTDVDIEHASVYGVSVNVLRDRLRKKWDKGDAITKPNNGKPGIDKKNIWYINNEKIPIEMVQQARDNGLSYKQVRGRVIGGMPLERAISEPVTRRNLSREEAKFILSNGISLRTYHTRINKGWSKERASTEPVDEKKRNKRAIKTDVKKELPVSSSKPTKKYKFKAEVKVPHIKKPIVIGYFETLQESAIAEKQALEELNRHG